MKHLTNLFFLLLVTALSTSCRTKYIPVETKVTETLTLHDTTFTEKLVPYRDSVSKKDTSSFLSNPYAYSYAVWDNGTLHHSLGIWPTAVLLVKIPYYMERTKRIEIPKPYPVEKIVQVEKKLSGWQQLRIWLGNLVLLGAGIYLLIRLIKRKI